MVVGVLGVPTVELLREVGIDKGNFLSGGRFGVFVTTTELTEDFIEAVLVLRSLNCPIDDLTPGGAAIMLFRFSPTIFPAAGAEICLFINPFLGIPLAVVTTLDPDFLATPTPTSGNLDDDVANRFVGVAGNELTLGIFSFDGSSLVNVPWRFNSFEAAPGFSFASFVGLFFVTCFSFEMSPDFFGCSCLVTPGVIPTLELFTAANFDLCVGL